jgi:hypothetical protein
MPQTRRAASAQDKQASAGKEDDPPVAPQSQPHNAYSALSKGKKRKSASDDTTLPPLKHSKQKTTEDKSKAPLNSIEPASQNEPSTKPRLATPDLEFDYDRTQLRDPRPTPGRSARPRYGSMDIPDDLKAQLEATREIPGPPPKPKGRLNNVMKNEMFVAEARQNPLKTFHDLHRCYDKGRAGSPTHDRAGFELDYDKVADWMKPQVYNKKRMVSGMERAVDRRAREEEAIYALFFNGEAGGFW